MPRRWLSRNDAGMRVSARLRPTASSRDQPNVRSACEFQVTMVPVESMPTNASCAVSTISRARASLSASRASAVRRSSSAIAATIRCATAMAKCCSSSVHARSALVCSAQSTPTDAALRRSGTSSIEKMPLGMR